MAIRNERANGFIFAEAPSIKDNHLEFGLTPDGGIFIRIENSQGLVVCSTEDARSIALTLIELAHDVEAGHIELPIVHKEPEGTN